MKELKAVTGIFCKGAGFVLISKYVVSFCTQPIRYWLVWNSLYIISLYGLLKLSSQSVRQKYSCNLLNWNGNGKWVLNLQWCGASYHSICVWCFPKYRLRELSQSSSLCPTKSNCIQWDLWCNVFKSSASSYILYSCNGILFLSRHISKLLQ